MNDQQAGENTSDERVAQRTTLTIVIGAIVAIAAAAGILASGRLLFVTLTQVLDESALVGPNEFIIVATWVVFFLAMLVSGVLLIQSGSRGKLRDIVPGIWLYLAGFALFVNGMYLLLYQRPVAGLVLVFAGLMMVYAEWKSDLL